MKIKLGSFKKKIKKKNVILLKWNKEMRDSMNNLELKTKLFWNYKLKLSSCFNQTIKLMLLLIFMSSKVERKLDCLPMNQSLMENQISL